MEYLDKTTVMVRLIIQTSLLELAGENISGNAPATRCPPSSSRVYVTGHRPQRSYNLLGVPVVRADMSWARSVQYKLDAIRVLHVTFPDSQIMRKSLSLAPREN
ncbi:hypothetical protein J6590_012220 [Homalodisca vitripennis]|nr:hypothetical protein J6590_012220 [Homalodisca vitripennis]